MSRGGAYDRHITIFSPDGKLYQIEYAFKAIRLPGDTTIGVRGTEAVCLITTKKVEDKLVDASTVTRIHNITPTIGTIVTGRVPDARALVYKARSIAADFEFENGYTVPVRHLSNELANYNQIFTQHAYKRVPGCSVMLGAIDEELGPRLYLVDPAGACYGYKAAATGNKEQEAMSTLEKLVKEKEEAAIRQEVPFQMREKETVEVAIEALQKVLGVDFKSNQVEAAIVTKSNPRFRLLTEKEIDNYLTAISEKD